MNGFLETADALWGTANSYLGTIAEKLAIEVGSAAVFVVPLVLLVCLLLGRGGGIGRVILLVLFALYLCAVLAMTGVPSVGTMQWEPDVQWIPFRGVWNNLGEFEQNILLFVPLGVFVPLLWQRGRTLTGMLVTGILFSGLIEWMQMFSLRAADINDVIANTTGALIGWLIGGIVWRRIPAQSRHGWVEPAMVFACSVLVMAVLQPQLADVLWNMRLGV